MSDELKNKALDQLEVAAMMGNSCMLEDEANSFSLLNSEKFIAYAIAAVAEITGEESSFSKHIEQILDDYLNRSWAIEGVVGVVQAVQAAIESGLLEGHRKLIRGELFSDYLDMASHLLHEGYKDAAAVIAGSSLEIQLRSVCDKHNVPTIDQKGEQQIPRKAESLNTDLRKHGAYDKNTQKLVTAWLGTRNDSAHGNYQNYSSDTVEAMLVGLRGFILSHS